MDDVIKEAKLKALSLLNYMDRTESQLRQKLKEKFYNDEVIDQVVEYVKSFGYINDVNYAERYIRSKQSGKSRREIHAALVQKGVGRDDIETAMERCFEREDELEAIRRLCEKKHFSPEEASDAEKQKIYGYLVRKGFRNEEIRQVIQVSS